MGKSKNIFKLFSLFALFVLGLIFFAPSNTEAVYDSSLNTVLTGENQFVIDPRENKLIVTIQYQYQVKGVQVYICKATASVEGCMGSDNISTFKDLKDYEDPTGEMRKSEVNNTTQETDTYIYAPTGPLSGMAIENYPDGTYRVVVKASFCNMRNNRLSDCASDDNWTADPTTQSWQTIYNQTIELNGAFTGNAQVNAILGKVLTYINSYVIPALWVLLAALLIIRGVLLAIAIVKSSDEAEVRSSKIKGMIWLIVGVFAGYAITIAATAVMTLLGYGGVFK